MLDSRYQPRNLSFDDFSQSLDWGPNKRLDSLQYVFAFVDRYCTRAIQWYHIRKKNKQRLGYFLRFLSILAVAVAGIIPVVSEMICRPDRAPCISPGWATVAIAAAALFIALDRFSGYTSGWVRYVRSAHRLTELQAQFRLDWCMYLQEKADGKIDETVNNANNTKETGSIKKQGLHLCKEYIASVNSVVGRETDAWAQEFQQVLVQFENSANQSHNPLEMNGNNANGSGKSE